MVRFVQVVLSYSWTLWGKVLNFMEVVLSVFGHISVQLCVGCLRSSCIGSWTWILLFFGCCYCFVSHGLSRSSIHFSWDWSLVIVRGVCVGSGYSFLDSEQMIDIAEFWWWLRSGRNGVGIGVMILLRHNIFEPFPRKVVVLGMIEILDTGVIVFLFSHILLYEWKFTYSNIISLRWMNSKMVNSNINIMNLNTKIIINQNGRFRLICRLCFFRIVICWGRGVVLVCWNRCGLLGRARLHCILFDGSRRVAFILCCSIDIWSLGWGLCCCLWRNAGRFRVVLDRVDPCTPKTRQQLHQWVHSLYIVYFSWDLPGRFPSCHWWSYRVNAVRRHWVNHEESLYRCHIVNFRSSWWHCSCNNVSLYF